MTRRLIKCQKCNHTFFTSKITMTPEEIKLNNSKLKGKLIEHKNILLNHRINLTRIEKELKDTNIIIKKYQSDIEKLNFKVQCAKCGIKFPILDNEVTV